MIPKVPTSAFATLRSMIDPESVDRSQREQDSMGTVSLLVLRAKGEIDETLRDLLSLGISANKIRALVNRELLHRVREHQRGVDEISVSDQLAAVREVARRVERTGLRLHGSKWRDRVRPGDFRFQ